MLGSMLPGTRGAGTLHRAELVVDIGTGRVTRWEGPLQYDISARIGADIPTPIILGT